VDFACLGVSFRIFMETEFRHYWGRITFVRTCEIFSVKTSMRELRFLNHQNRPDCSVLCHCRIIQKQFINLSIYSLTMILTMFVWVFVFLCSVFILSVLMSGDCAWFLFTYDLLLFSCVQWFLIENFFDYFLKVILLSSVCKCNCFSDRNVTCAHQLLG